MLIARVVGQLENMTHKNGLDATSHTNELAQKVALLESRDLGVILNYIKEDVPYQRITKIDIQWTHYCITKKKASLVEILRNT